jgi:FAD-dependent urate hydroxylase
MTRTATLEIARKVSESAVTLKGLASKGRYMSTSEVLVIGAGPFGLSISAHLRELGVEHRIVGRPMDTWRAHTPIGMNLKSEPYAADMASPKAGYDVARYCRSHGLDYVERVIPLSVERFLGYADWYTEQLVPDVADVTVTDVTHVDGGFRVAFADAEPLTARQVVVATGVLPHAYIPRELSDLPSDLVTHTVDHHNLDRFQGRRVAVVGAGQSAIETAALLNEAGAEVQVVVRRPVVNWLDPNPEQLSPLGRIRRPATKLCEGWRCVFWNTPAAFRRLPQDMRVMKALTVTGTSVSWWLKDRIDGVVDVLTNHHVREAMPVGSGVQLLIDGPERSSIDVDHVIAGTGFRIDLARLSFLPERLRTRIATLNGYPMVTRVGESTVPGLYFVGSLTAVSLGPSARFIAGTHNTAGKLARSVARRSELSGRRAERSKNRSTACAPAQLTRSSDNNSPATRR